MRWIVLLMATIGTGCLHAPIKKDTPATYYNARVDPVFRRVANAWSERGERLHYVVYLEEYESDKNPASTDLQRVFLAQGFIQMLDDDALAVLIGHEISHVDAGVSAAILGRVGAVLASAGTGVGVGIATTWWIGALSGGTLLFTLPLIVIAAEDHQHPAHDRFGIDLAQRAGYDARQGVEGFCRAAQRWMTTFGYNSAAQADTHTRCDAMRAYTSRLP